MEDPEGPIPTKKQSRKTGKHGHHQHHHTSSLSSKLKHTTSSSGRVIPPSFVKAQSPTAKISRHQDQYSGLWECYYDDDDDELAEDGGAFEDDGSRLKNIRGFLMKRRKSPLKGWHKRYVVVERGFLYFSRSHTQMVKGKVTNTLDLGLAFIHCDGSSRRINVDGDNHVIHLKTKNASHFAAWSSCLVSHEMYRKTQLASGKASARGKGFSPIGGTGGHHQPLEGASAPTGGAEFEVWVGKTQKTISGIKKDLEGIHESLEAMSIYVRSPRASAVLSATPSSSYITLASIGEKADSVSDTSSVHNGASSGGDPVKGEGPVAAKGEGPGKDGAGSRKKFAIRKTKKDKKKESTSNLSPDPSPGVIPVAVPLFEEPASATSIDQGVVRDDFTAIAKLVYAQFCEMMEKLDKLDGGLSQAAENNKSYCHQQESIISNQLVLLRQTMLQNRELRDRLAQIQSIASGSESKVHLSTPVGSSIIRSPSQHYHRGGGSIPRFDSFMSLHSTLSEKFFDALDEVHEFSSSEDEAENTEDEESGEESDSELFSSIPPNVLSSMNSHTPNVLDTPITEEEEPSSHEVSPDPSTSSHDASQEHKLVVRRRKLPAPISDRADFSLWGLLRKNIGKDLSKISMPVSMNEPLSALQRLCEELEYSELLDTAANCPDPFDRMVRVAAFAVSSYALSAHRAGRKPFNPLLGETYECIREDKGFKFIAEQVSHHPPIAACHCSSPNFEFWEDARIKSKFWGKSMEVFPIGVSNVVLPKHNDHYQWKKVTSCIHNVLGGQRWVDQYGEMTVTNKDECSCKLTFVKASYWSSKKCVVYGDVYDSEGTKVRHLFGTWNQAMYCGEEEQKAECIWKMSKMPANSEQYYGFSYFAMELNELLEGQQEELPCTDCRFRPDQWLLENGRIQEAESEKRRVEQIQREARAERERLGEEWTPNFFKRVEDEEGGHDEKWVSNESYWTHRETGFKDINLPSLW